MYNLHSLGWNSFQQLCLTVTREILGQTVESFLDSHDGGRDGAFTGEWTAKGQEDLSGPFVIQCKFKSRANYSLKASDLSNEIGKAKRLVGKGICRSYVLMTNAGVAGDQAEKITERLKAVGVEHVRILGSTWINDQIRENKRLRMLVPRVYGLGDLSQILDERAYAQARSILDSMREDLAKVVITDAYRKSVDAIDNHSFVLLIGEPASGKTTVASLLSMAAIDKWNASILKLDHPDDVTAKWNPNEPSQFFWLDDAFGVTQYDETLVSRWNYLLARIPAMLPKGAKIVITSRDYIYNRARNSLKASTFPLLNESQVVIDVRKLCIQEREQILYNHIKLGNQPRSFRTKIKPHLQAVASHPRFIPEIARRLGNRFFTKDLLIGAKNVKHFVEGREQFLQEILLNLDTDSKAALALIYMRNGRLESPIQPQESERLALERLGSTGASCIDALDALKGSLVRLSSANDDRVWEFSHPTVGDAYAEILAQSPEHIDIFIQGTVPARLLDQITCGEVGLEKAVVIQRAFFPHIIEKLRHLAQSNSIKMESHLASSAKRKLHSFLAYRCSKEFLSLYLQHDSDLLTEVCESRLLLFPVPETRLAKRLQELGLLPERHRKKIVDKVSYYTLEGQDASALNDEGIQSFFTEDEYEELVKGVRLETLPRLEDIRLEWEDNYYLETESPEDYIYPFLELCDSLLSQFGDEQDTALMIDHQVSLARDWIDQYEAEWSDEELQQLGQIEATDGPESSRSIFDDIDADEGLEAN